MYVQNRRRLDCFKRFNMYSTRKRFGAKLGRKRDGHMRMDLGEIDVNTRTWIDLAQDGDYWISLVNVASNI